MEARFVVSMLKSPQARAVLVWLLSWYIRVTLRLQRGFRVEGVENLHIVAENTPFVLAFWHETLPSILVLWRETRRHGMRRPVVALVSRHRDGQMIGGILQNFGIELVSGSSSKGGVASMQELVKKLHGGMNIAITPDGPRGPARCAAAGVAALAGIAGARILPCGIATTRFVVIRKSWDKMRVPLPFGRMVLVCGAPVTVPREQWREALPGIEAALNAAQAKAQDAA